MSNIPEFFRGKRIFITGGSGFLGKVLIEKLLRSCPDISCIYVLIRDKKGKSHEERIKELINIELFDVVKKLNEDVANKLVAIPGDITKLGLGISSEDRQLLTSTVDIIYNCAAAVRFDQSLKDATVTNVQSSREICLLALECKNLKVMLHVSTAYCNVHVGLIEEKTYPPLFNWQELIDLAKNEGTNENFNILTEKFLGVHPNTYVFTKQISEAVFVDMCSGKVPIIICRPSVILPTVKEPIEGWVDNFNGPFSLCIPVLKGLADAIYIQQKESILDCVFVDNVSKSLITSVWCACRHDAINKSVEVYNACSDILWYMKDFTTAIKTHKWTYPLEDRLWFPHSNFAKSCWYQYYILIILFNVIPAVFFDTCLKISGRKPQIFNVIKKLFICNCVLNYFMTKSISFKTDNYLAAEGQLEECDKPAFQNLKILRNDTMNVSRGILTGIKRFMFKEPYPIKQQTFRNTYRLYYLDMAVSIAKYLLMIFIVWKFGLISILYEKIFTPERSQSV